MIMHIIRKDWRLLWPFVAGLALLQLLAEWARYESEVRGVVGGSEVLDVVAALGAIVLMAALVQQDPVPGTRQDWLTRPIKRPHLLAAKLAFVLVLVHGPVFLANTVDALAAGFSFPQALVAAASRGAFVFTIVSVSTIALAAVTRNLLELIVAAIVASVALEAAAHLIKESLGEVTGTACPTCGTSIEWITMLARIAVLVVGTAVVLALQYGRRGATRSARAAVVATIVAFAAAGQLPWSLAFGLQQRATGSPASRANVALELDLSRGRGAAPDVGSSALAELLRARSSLAGQMTDEELRGRLLRETEGTTIGLPLAIAAAPADAVLWADRVLARLIDADGNVLYRGVGDSLEVHAEAEDVQTLFIPSSVFDRHENRALRLELDYSLTSLEPDDGLTMPAAGGDARFANNDRCSAEPLRNRSAVRMRCITLYRPSCYTIEAENRTNGAVAGYRLVCSPDYARGRFESRLLGGFEVDVPFAADARLEDWILRFTPYSPREHFVRHVTLPQLRLADWTLEDTR